MAALIALTAPGWAAERAQETSPEGPLVVVERGADYRVVEWLSSTTDDSGQRLVVTNSYTELATGLHFMAEDGQWQETVAEFGLAPGGFVAARGPHQVALSSDLTVPGAVTVVTAEGLTFRLAPILLAYVDRASGASVRLADVQPTTGELIAPNTVLYSQAFDTVSADYRAVYSASGFEADVILRGQLPDPALFGLNAETTDLEVYTEVFEGQPTATSDREVPLGEEESGLDVDLYWGSMVMGRGRAFDWPTSEESPEIPVRKAWERRENRDFLIERTAYRELQPLLQDLPEAATPNPRQRLRQNRAGRTAQFELPARRPGLPVWPRTSAGRLVAGTTRSPNQEWVNHSAGNTRGVVLDFTAVNSSTNQTFNSLTTYYVSGTVNLSVVATFEPGTVIKYAKTNQPSLKVLANTALTWLGAPYRPVILTAYDDNSVGEALPSATGSPSGTYAQTALSLDGTGRTTPLVLTNLSVRYASSGLEGTYFGTSGPLIVRHAQFIQCNGVFRFQVGDVSAVTYFIENALVYNSVSVFNNQYYAKVTGDFLTIDSAVTLFQISGGACTLGLTNSVLVNAGTFSGVTLVNSGTPPSASFFAAGAGVHYLNLTDPTVAAWFASHPASLPPPTTALAAELPKTTVTAPGVLPATLPTDVTLSGAANPNITPPEERIGYHYWPIHFLSSGVTLTNATLTLTNGVVVAGFSNGSITLASGAKLNSQGRPDALNRLGWCSAVQELTTGSTTANRSLLEISSGAAVRPEIEFRYTAVEMGADNLSRRRLIYTSQNLEAVELRDSQISGVEFNINMASSGWQTVNLENSLFRDCRVTVYKSYTGDMTVSLRNTLFRGGTIILYYYYLDAGGPQWICTDNLFDGASVSAYSTATNRLYAGWNGYSTASAILGGVSNRVGIVADWASGGPLGSWYYPTNGGSTSLYNLVNNGSKLATNYGLYHYTTRTDQTKEGTTKVDIGFHYATTSNGVLADTDLDGIPDVVEDADGNGSVNGSESNWQNADSDGDGALDGEEIANFTNPLDKQSWIPKRLAAWWWEGTTGTWKLGDRGQAPITPPTGNEFQTNGIVGSGVYLRVSTNAPLRYEFADAYGRPNLRLDQGSVRMWFKPNWTLPISTNWSATLAQVGKFNEPSLGWWSWYLHSDANSDFWVKFSQGASNYWPLSRFDSKLDQANWATAQWHELALVYGRDFLKLFHNSYQNSASTNGVLDYFPTAAGLSNGIHLGSDPTGIYAVEATVDSLETFNYPIGFPEIYRNQQLTITIITNSGFPRLQFTRNYQGYPTPSVVNYPSYPDPWPLTLWRRALGSTSWGSEILSSSTNQTWIDTNVVVGVSYEYQAKLANYVLVYPS